MEAYRPILLDVWREACRHIEIEEAVVLIAPILARKFPVHEVIVRRIDAARSCVETVAIGMLGEKSASKSTRTECKPHELERLLSWCRRNEIAHGAESAILRRTPHAIPATISGDVLLGPLSGREGPIGLLLLVANPGAVFNEEHEQAMAALLEPFSVAIENDSRVRELTTLREVAEADKRSLLTRLGRHDVTDTIVGAEAGLKHVIERATLVANSDAPVLIFGETGSGKEVIARAVHVRSRRANGPFLRINCGAIPPDLIDSELFGHEKGSFTGATTTRKGWFERADGGTLFLDEIGELPLAAQVRLLRIVQDGTFERVGGQRQMTVDVRIVAATHRNLQVMVADEKFREDLWYRLAVFPIHLPALREHLEDIPELATHFALKASRRFGTPPLTPTQQDVNLLVQYPWPGNVRELQSVIERAVILGDGQQIEVAKALGVTPPTVPLTAKSVASKPRASLEDNAFLSLDAAMARHIEAALVKTRGRVEGRSGAAALLGINPHTLRARMRKLEIDWRRYREHQA